MRSEKARWRRPPPEIVRLVRSLAVDDARRDHDEAIAANARRGNLPMQSPKSRGRQP